MLCLQTTLRRACRMGHLSSHGSKAELCARLRDAGVVTVGRVLELSAGDGSAAEDPARMRALVRVPVLTDNDTGRPRQVHETLRTIEAIESLMSLEKRLEENLTNDHDPAETTRSQWRLEKFRSSLDGHFNQL